MNESWVRLAVVIGQALVAVVFAVGCVLHALYGSWWVALLLAFLAIVAMPGTFTRKGEKP